MEHLLLRSKCSIFHNILENLTFQRRPKVLVWSTRLIINFSSFENIMNNGAFAPKEQMFHLHNILENLTFQRCLFNEVKG